MFSSTPRTRVMTGGLASSGFWPVAVAFAIRAGVWFALPDARFASDEESYYTAGTRLLAAGEHDLFWPPFTGWFIAVVQWTLQTTDLRWIRAVWIVLDIACVLAVRTLASRIAPAIARGDASRAERFTTLATLGYALYLPAISFAQFTTSETLALLMTLLVLVLVTKATVSSRDLLLAGLFVGTLTLTRPSLLPLLAFVPAALALGRTSGLHLRHAAIFIAAGSAIVGAVMLWNWSRAGEPTISTNSAYNLYIGNRDLYAEDLDLFHPAATPEQIQFRRQFWSGELTYPAQPASELQREALAWIAAHPGAFARRALGRLARVFAPKTDVLELAGGERAAGIFSPTSLALLALANAQWVIVLFGGVAGLAALWRLKPEAGVPFVFVVLGSLPLCLVAISKPRYAFVFEPLLLLGAMAFVCAPRDTLSTLGRGQRWTVVLISLFLIWGWIAWLIFAFSSRLALNPAS